MLRDSKIEIHLIGREKPIVLFAKNTNAQEIRQTWNATVRMGEEVFNLINTADGHMSIRVNRVEMFTATPYNLP